MTRTPQDAVMRVQQRHGPPLPPGSDGVIHLEHLPLALARLANRFDEQDRWVRRPGCGARGVGCGVWGCGARGIEAWGRVLGEEDASCQQSPARNRATKRGKGAIVCVRYAKPDITGCVAAAQSASHDV
eukprot:135479-Chlamydomonas_euryale.AAC.1